VWMVYGGGGDSMFLLGDNAEIEGCGDALWWRQRFPVSLGR
jgi:hypothetical protein